MKPTIIPALVAALLLMAGCSLTKNSVPSVAAAASGKVQVVITASPGPAEVWLDGGFIGSTPLDYYLVPGTYRMELRKEGYESWTRQLIVREGNPTRVTGELRKR